MHYTGKYEIESKMTPDDSLHSNLYLNVSSTTINVALFCLVSDVSLHCVHECIQSFCITGYFRFQNPNISFFPKRNYLHLRGIRTFGNVRGIWIPWTATHLIFKMSNLENMNHSLQKKITEICFLSCDS